MKENSSKVKKPFYKKWLFLLTVAMLAMGVFGCGGSNNSIENISSNASDSSEPVQNSEKETESSSLSTEVQYVSEVTESTETSDSPVSADDADEPVADTSSSSSETQSVSSDNFINDVRNAIQDSIGANESITDVVLKDGDLCISVDLSNVDPAPLTMEDLALSRAGSIADSFLDLTDYDDQWDTITIDFGDIGKVINKKSDVKENEYGMRCFAEENFKLE